MRKTKTAREILKLEYKGSKNFLTPNIIKRGKLNPNLAYEFSTGRGFLSNENMYGVSIASYSPKKQRTNRQLNLSKSFYNRNEAEAYINKLKNRAKKRY